MKLKDICIKNFRRLKDVHIELDTEKTIFVGANNSGKTSATHIFQLFLRASNKEKFTIYDFNAECWDRLNLTEIDLSHDVQDLPVIRMAVL
jgi:predicted ATP-dependent endonuclease of OLD family